MAASPHPAAERVIAQALRARLPLTGRLPPFVGNVLAIGGRTAVGQVIATSIAPVLTRVYSPALFGLFGSFSAIMLPIANICCLKYDSAIVLEHDDDGARAVVSASLIAGLAITIGFYIVLAALYFGVDAVHRAPAAWPLLIFGGPTILTSAAFAIGLGIKTRAADFKEIGSAQIARPATTAGAQLALALTPLLPSGLLLGQLVGQIAGLFTLTRRPASVRLRDSLAVPAAAVRAKFRTHRAFAFYSVPQTILSSLATSIPMLLLGWLFDAQAVGYFWLAYRILMLPSLIITESVRSAFYRQAVTVHQQSGNLRRELERTTVLLTAVALPVYLVLLVAGPFLFALVFGKQWAMAGEFARLIGLPWLVALASVPANVLVPILGIQRGFLVQEAIGFVLRSIALVVGARIGGAVTAVMFYSIAASVLPILWMIYVGVLAKTPPQWTAGEAH